VTRTVAATIAAPLLHASPAVGFEQPFEMLEACHERVKRSLDLLQRLGVHLDTHGADAQAAAAARDVLRYFDIAGPLHHEDEERHVLPRLRASGHAALAERLHADHLALSAAWRGWRTVLEGVCAGHWDRTDAARMRAGWHEFEARYEAHIAIEEAVAFPSAAHGLAADTLASMGHEMAGRRRSTPRPVTPPGAPA
jgi:hemerythrin-like domain-containing protein